MFKMAKKTTGFGLFSSLSKVKIYFFLLFASNLSYFNSFKLPYKIRLLGFRSPLIKEKEGEIFGNTKLRKRLKSYVRGNQTNHSLSNW